MEVYKVCKVLSYKLEYGEKYKFIVGQTSVCLKIDKSQTEVWLTENHFNKTNIFSLRKIIGFKSIKI